MALSGRVALRMPTLGIIPGRVVWATLGFILLLGVWEGYGWLTAPTRIAPELHTALSQDPNALYDVSVNLAFAPRQFHIKLFQSYGTFAGTQGTTVLIRRVSSSRIQEMARKYWVQRIDLAQIQ
jgi:hypothetical protein